ncbi:MAG: VOC family protein [Candidatus Omnitrophica bacterium]|nr:VOC family protein [Candidatus Omnitrophota bacterium]MCA9416129.1 VOC family protein [Candidatus Omnitrophota bacterium]MCA9437344.1 VOC family protein [Candidatus Omnitrophota bacterium]
MKVTAVDHINIVVKDLERSVRFYTEVLGLLEKKRAHLEGDWIERIVGLSGVSADVAYVEAVGGAPRIELLQYLSPKGESLPQCSKPNTTGLRHIAFRVEDIHSMAKRIEQGGGKLFGPPVSVPNTVIRHDDGQKILCYFLDPDGVLLELAQYS